MSIQPPYLLARLGFMFLPPNRESLQKFRHLPLSLLIQSIGRRTPPLNANGTILS